MTFAGRTFASLKQEVLSYQFQAGKYESLVGTWLNDAQRKVVLESEMRKEQMTEVFSVPAGATAVTLPSGYYEFIDFYNSVTKTPMIQLEVEEFDRLQPSSGVARYFAVEEDQLLLYPMPTHTEGLTFKYFGLPTDMVADTDEPGIPKRYHETLIGYAMWKAYLRENDYQAAAEWKVIWDADLLKLRGQANDDLHDGPDQVEGQYAQESGMGGPSFTLPRP